MRIETTPWCDEAPLATYLEALGLSQPDTQNAADDAHPESGGAPLLMHASLALTLQLAMEREVLLEAAVDAWSEAIEALMNRYRRRRASALLVSLEAALADPEALGEAAETKGLTLTLPKECESVTVPVAPFYQLLAETLVQQRPALQGAVALLEALSLPLGEATADDAVLDPALAWQEQREGLKAAAELPILREALEQAQGEREALQARLGQAEETAAEKAQVVAQQQATLQALRDDQTRVEQALEEATERADSQLQQLRQCVKTLETENEEHQQQADIHQQRAQHYRQQAETRHQDVQRYSEQAQASRQEVARLQTALKQLQQEHGQLRKRLQQATALPARPVNDKPPVASPSHREELRCLHESEWFDPEWYRQEYPDVRASDADPAEHYLLYGARLGRNPSPHFLTDAYLQRYPDVAKTGANPLVHYLLHGRAEGREAVAVNEPQ